MLRKAPQGVTARSQTTAEGTESVWRKVDLLRSGVEVIYGGSGKADRRPQKKASHYVSGPDTNQGNPRFSAHRDSEGVKPNPSVLMQQSDCFLSFE